MPELLVECLATWLRRHRLWRDLSIVDVKQPSMQDNRPRLGHLSHLQPGQCPGCGTSCMRSTLSPLVECPGEPGFRGFEWARGGAATRAAPLLVLQMMWASSRRKTPAAMRVLEIIGADGGRCGKLYPPNARVPAPGPQPR